MGRSLRTVTSTRYQSCISRFPHGMIEVKARKLCRTKAPDTALGYWMIKNKHCHTFYTVMITILVLKYANANKNAPYKILELLY